MQQRAQPDARKSARASSLCGGVVRVQRRARGHEQAVALRPAKRDVAYDFGDANAAPQSAVRAPDRDTAVPDIAAGVARRPDIAIDIRPQTVGAAADAVDHRVAEQAE